MTGKQRERFTELFNEYARTSRALKPESVRRMGDAFAQARAYAKNPATIGVAAVREFIMPVITKVATIAGAPDAMWARWNIQRTEPDFIPLLKEMLGVSVSSARITREQFCKWRKEFFKCAGYKANQAYNRLVVACFPEQFCSVVTPSRLKVAIGKMHGEGLMASVVVDMTSDGAWFNLCEAIVPAVKEGLPGFGLVSRVSFIAAIADGGPKE